jgi:hypothetical protein
MNGPQRHILVQKMGTMMKNGKSIIFLAGCFFIGYTIAKSKDKPKEKKTVTAEQYKNRLEEFCLYDLEKAKREYDEFINMGFTELDSFELTVVARISV